MKKLLIVAAAILVAVSCSRNGNSVNGEKTGQDRRDSIRTADSIVLAEAAKAAAEQARQDSLNREIEKRQKALNELNGVLNKYKNKSNISEYFLTDLDNDNIPELWILDVGEVSMDTKYHVFSFDNTSEVLKKDVYPTGRTAQEFYKKNGQLYIWFGFQAGGECLYKLSLQNNKVKEKLIYECEFNEDYEGDDEAGALIFIKGNKKIWKSFQNTPQVKYYPLSNRSPLNKYFN